MVGAPDFLFVLAVLYFLECFRLLRPGEIVADRTIRGTYRIRKALFYPSSQWGWMLLNPFRPLGGAFCLRKPEAEEGAGLLSFDVKAIQTCLADLRKRTRLLRALSAGQFVVCWVLLPIAAFWIGLTLTLLVLAPVALAISVAATVAYRKLAAALHPHQPKLDYYGNVVKLILYPVSVLRAIDLVSFELLTTYDPIAVATVLTGKDSAAKLAADEYLHVKYRMPVEDSTALTEYRDARLELIESFAEQQKLRLKERLAPPAPQAGELSYCPSCRAQYRLKQGFCADCPDVALTEHVAQEKR